MERSLRSGFLDSMERFPDRLALALGDHALTYRELAEGARAIAATLEAHLEAGKEPVRLTAVLGHRHPVAFAAVIGALLRGHGYVPLNPTFPATRSAAMLMRSGCRALVVDPSGLTRLDELLSQVDRALVVLVPDLEDLTSLRERWQQHTLLGARDLLPPSACRLGEVRPEAVAYLLFTSGSTGEPKGVPVAHRNVTPFVDFMCERYRIRETDRFSQTFDLTFDLSVFDMFCAWARGACLCVPTAEEKALPARYLTRHGITVWFGVPSSAVLMSRLRMLQPGRYEALRWVLFCGEALPVDIVERVAEAAPHATIENLYGPTELTIACALYRWQGARSRAECELGVVPIGEPYPGMVARVVDAELREVPRGEPGELVMTGPQMTSGYWCDRDRTAAAFVVPAGDDRVFYRTGDRVRWPEGGPLRYLGRADDQLKIQGYRVELGEVEAVLRAVAGADPVAAVGWPRSASGAEGVVAFVGAPEADALGILREARARLPTYMQPSVVRLLEALPTNANGKVDRRALLHILEGESHA